LEEDEEHQNQIKDQEDIYHGSNEELRSYLVEEG
jgi:hypothetical protein